MDEYLRTEYRPDCDFVDGELRERNAGEHDHNRIQLLLGICFYSHEKEWNIEVIPEQRTRVSKSRVRIPDVCLVRRDISVEQVTVTPQILCIEVLSLEDRLSRVTKRLDDFAAMGVRNLWIIDPAYRLHLHLTWQLEARHRSPHHTQDTDLPRPDDPVCGSGL